MPDNKLNIVWISDIHFRGAFPTKDDSKKQLVTILNPEIKQYLDNIIEKITANHAILDYIILSGDLANSGAKDDYVALWKFFLQPVFDGILKNNHQSNLKLICIPGNHDLNWDNFDIIQLIPISGSFTGSDKFKNKIDFFKQNLGSFIQLFENFTWFIKTFIPKQGDNYKVFVDFSDANRFTISNNYESRCLSGYIMDHLKKCIFILFNSSWFSIGPSFKKVYKENIKKTLGKNYDRDESTEEINKLVDVLYSFTEIGNQIIGYEEWFENIETIQAESVRMFKQLRNLNEYLIISIIHHPLNWLDLAQYNYHPNRMDNKDCFKSTKYLIDLLEMSDILLSGHEHAPINTTQHRYYSETLHFQSGCFFEKPAKDSSLVSGDRYICDSSWYSLLTINIDTGLINQQRILVGPSLDAKEHPLIKETLNKKGKRFKLEQNRKAQITENFSSGRNTFEKYLKSIKLIDESFTTELIADTAQYCCLFSSSKSSLSLFFLAKNSSFWHDIKEKDFRTFFESCIIKKNVTRVYFFSLDLFVVKDAYQMDDGQFGLTRTSTLQQIVKVSDTFFDNFRNEFFSAFDEHSANFQTISKIPIINSVIPYWHSHIFTNSHN